MEKTAVTQFPNADERFMRIALREAAKGLGHTSPNPAVGAVVVWNNKIVARGHHKRAGQPHAEIECLNQLCSHVSVARSPRTAHRAVATARSTMYVTLEPCCTTGRTGPCTTQIIAAGIKEVVIGAIDPNPRHSGKGIRQLKKAGIEVRTGVLEAECTALNEGFNKWITTGRPFVIAKCGMSLDGRLTRPPGEPQWLTSAQSRRHAHGLRAVVDAILVGAETVRVDDPRLTVRNGRSDRQPLLVVLSRSGKLPRNARIFEQPTRVYGQKSLAAVLRDLGKQNIISVLIEGGGNVLGQALDARLIDKVQIYLAPMFTGGPVLAFGERGAGETADALHLQRVTYEQIRDDLCVTGYPSSE